ALAGLSPVGSASAQVAGTGSVRISDDSRLGDEASAVRGRDVPGLAVDPTNPDHVVEVDVDHTRGECDFASTFDGGRTWARGHLRGPAGFPVPACAQRFDSGGYAHGNASVAFGAGQNVYTTYSSHRGADQRPESNIIAGEGDDILVNRSGDGGRTFEVASVAIRGGPEPQPYYIRSQLAVETGAGTGGADRIYLSAWGVFVTSGGAQAGGGDRRMVTTRSDDGGRTWTAPIDAQAPGEKVREPAQPAVGPDGTVYLGWENRDDAPAPNNIVIARSNDRGATWQRFNVGLSMSTNASRAGHPRLTVDRRSGHLYVAYQAFEFSPETGGDLDIVFRRSTDRGQTWSAPVRVNDDPIGSGLDQNNAWVSVAPNGRIDVVWLDRRHRDQAGGISTCCKGATARTGLADIYLASSTDGGASFGPNRRVNNRHLNLDVGLINVGGYTWYGAVSASLDANRVMVAWTDSREGNFNNGAQDIYTAVMDVSDQGPTPVQRLPRTQSASTPVTLSRMAYPGGLEAATTGPIAVSKVVIVPEGDGPAALSAAVLARGYFGPLLASPAARLTQEVRDEVRRMEPIGAFLVGSESQLSGGVVTDLIAAGIPADQIFRIVGTSPADTARLVAEVMDTRSDAARAAGTPAFETALIANPASPEASAAAGLGASLRMPVLYTDGAGVLPAATGAALSSLAVPNTLVVGGPGTVSDAVLRQLPNASRLAGAGPEATYDAVVAEAVRRGLPTNRAYVGDPAKPVEAAMLAAAVARTGGLQFLVPGGEPALAGAAIDRLGLRPAVDTITVVVDAVVGSGYRLVAADGGLFSFGPPFLGSLGGTRLSRPVVASATTPTGRGYWLVASDGGVFSFGDATFRGSTGALKLAAPIVAMAPTSSGRGYWLVAADGGVFAFGDAVFAGSTGAIRLNQPIVALAPTPSGRGYFLIARDGGVFAFGDATFRGSTGATRLNQPVVGAAATATGRGYYLVAADGGVFAFGDAVYRGSTGALRLARPIVGIAPSPSGKGYWLAAADGGVFAFGDATFGGSTGSVRLSSPIVGIAAG
ncbi:MAG: cell wall-binding repeat-containing protein, partial [Acidimicrobiales bacterium]